MKKLFLLFAAVVLTAISAKTFAQTSGTAPYIGATHQYWVNGSFGTPSGHASSTYTWWISSSTTDLLTRTGSTSDFTVVSTNGGADYDTSGETVNGIELTWNPSAAGNTYYLVVEENDGTCTNLKAVAIQPVNAFDVVFAAIDESDNDSDNPSRCAPDIALTASGTTITYDYGSDSYIYRISSAGLYSDWTFNYSFANTLGDATPTIEYSTDGSSYNTTAVSGSKTVTPSAAAATVYFRVSVDNGDTGGTAEEGLAGQSMVLTLTGISDGVSGPAHIYSSDGATEFTGAVEQTQTVNARPSTTGIQTN